MKWDPDKTLRHVRSAWFEEQPVRVGNDAIHNRHRKTWAMRGSVMSARNGDKARFQLRRKAGLRRRERARVTLAALRGVDNEQSGGMRGRLAVQRLVRGAAGVE